MKRVLPALVLCALVASHASAQAPRGRAREASFDQDPFAAAFHAIQKMGPDSDRDNHLIPFAQARTDAGQYEEAWQAASLIEDAGMKAHVLNRLANRLAEAGKLDRALEALTQVVTVIEDEVWMDNLPLDALRQAVGEEETWIPEFPYRTEKRKGALAYLIEDGRKSAVVGLLERAREIALDPDTDFDKDAVVLAGVSRRYAELGEKGKAEDTLSEALDAARKVEEDDDRAFALCKVAEIYVERGDRESAVKVLKEASEAGALPGARGGGALIAVARLYARLGMKEEAAAAAGALADEQDGALTLASIVWAEAPDEKGEALTRHLARALDVATSEKYENERSQQLMNVARFAGTRSPAMLAKVVESAEAINDGYERAKVLAVAADRYAEVGEARRALEVWERAFRSIHSAPLEKKVYGPGDIRIEHDREKGELMRVLARRFIAAGSAERVPEVARAIEENYWQALTVAGGDAAHVSGADLSLADLADELLRARQKDLALEVLDVACRVAEHEGENVSPYTRVRALAAIGSVYAKTGDKAKAVAYFQRALDATSVVEDYGGEKVSMLASLGAKYAAAGLKPDARARKTLRRIVRDIEKEL